MRLTEAFNWLTDPDADADRYTHFDPTTGVDTVRGRVFDCTGEPTLYAVERLTAIKRPFADFGERRPFVGDGLCAADLAQHRQLATRRAR